MIIKMDIPSGRIIRCGVSSLTTDWIIDPHIGYTCNNFLL